eukprot:6012957-Pyramimonas_sp.AAC.1
MALTNGVALHAAGVADLVRQLAGALHGRAPPRREQGQVPRSLRGSRRGQRRHPAAAHPHRLLRRRAHRAGLLQLHDERADGGAALLLRDHSAGTLAPK